MTDQAPPIMIVSPMGRSGTNLTKYLLTLHPRVTKGQIPEEYVLADATRLEEYAELFMERHRHFGWEKFFPGGEASPDTMLAAFGSAILKTMGCKEEKPPTRYLMKTPSLVGLETAYRLFPGVQIVVLIRDPRSTVSSSLRSHWANNTSLVKLGGRWAQGMRRLSDILKRRPELLAENRLILVRYEELVDDMVGQYRLLLEKLGLPWIDELADAVNNAPVVGSSFEGRDEDGTVNFTPIEKPAGFDPKCRWSDWTPEQHTRFNMVCGAMMKRWGYEPVRESKPAV